MRSAFSSLGLLGTLALAGLPAPAGAQAVGSEFQVNTYTTGDQRTGRDHLVAADAIGNFVVVWAGAGQRDSSGVFGRRYNREGVARGGEFLVNSYFISIELLPSVASNPSGNFVIVWESYDLDGSGWGIFGQRYDSKGVAQGAEFRVNSYTTNMQEFASVASDASGDFVVVWDSSTQDGSSGGIFGQRYDNEGVAQGGEFRVNSYTEGSQDIPSVASDAEGNFVVVWSGAGPGDSHGIFGQRYDSEGVALGAEFRVNSYTTDFQRWPSVASDASGNFVVVWQCALGYPLPPCGIFGQRYDSGGVAQGGEFDITSGTEGYLGSVAADASGNFVVVWESYGQDGSGYGIFGQRYDSGGVPQGNEFQINSFTPSHQRFPSVGAASTNQFVVAWQSDGQDGSGYGVFGQRFNFGDRVTVTVPNTNVRWRIGSQHIIQWTHNLGGGMTFRIDLDRDNDGNYEELIAAAAAASATRGSFAWTVTGPPSGTARVRISWTDDLGVWDASDVTFQVRP